MDRTVLVATCWFVTWTFVGYFICGPMELFGLYGGGFSGAIGGFAFALLTTIAWPWILPDFIWNWMDEE